jgi:hypothetical protein
MYTIVDRYDNERETWSKSRPFVTPDEGPSLETSPYIFQVVASLPTKACSVDWHYLH